MAWRKREPPESRVRETVAAEEETLGIPLRPSVRPFDSSRDSVPVKCGQARMTNEHIKLKYF